MADKFSMQGGDMNEKRERDLVSQDLGSQSEGLPPYESPTIELLGQMEALTGSGGWSYDDGWGEHD